MQNESYYNSKLLLKYWKYQQQLFDFLFKFIGTEILMALYNYCGGHLGALVELKQSGTKNYNKITH